MRACLCTHVCERGEKNGGKKERETWHVWVNRRPYKWKMEKMFVSAAMCARVRLNVTPGAACTQAEAEDVCALGAGTGRCLCPPRCKKEGEIICGECVGSPSAAISSASESRLCFLQIPLSSSLLFNYIHARTHIDTLTYISIWDFSTQVASRAPDKY